MKEYNIKNADAKSYRSNFLKNVEEEAPQISVISWGTLDGGAQRFGFVGGSMPVSSPFCSVVSIMQDSPYYQEFFGCGGKYLTKLGRQAYDESAFGSSERCQAYLDQVFKARQARLSKTSLSISQGDNFGSGVSLSASQKAGKMPASAVCLRASDKTRQADVRLLESSLTNDNNKNNGRENLLDFKRFEELKRRFAGSDKVKPYPKNYKYSHSVEDGGTDDKISFDDDDKLSYKLLDSRRVSAPSIKPFFDNYDLLKKKDTGSYCGFDGGCQVSYYGFWRDCSAIRAFIREMGDLKEYLDAARLQYASVKAFPNLKGWKVSFNPGRGALFGRVCRLPLCLSRGGLELYINIDVVEADLDFSDDGTGADVVLENCMTSEGRARLLDTVKDKDERVKLLDQHFRELSGVRVANAAFVLPCGGKSRAARVSVGAIFGEQCFRSLGMSLSEAGRLVKKVLYSIGFVATDETVGRFDFGFITDRVSVQQLKGWKLKDENGKNVDYRYISPGGCPHDTTDTEITIGRRGGAIFNRMYDKFRELEAHESKDGGEKKTYVYNMLGDDFIVAHHFDDVPLTRIEFELRREGLQNMRLSDGSVIHVRTLDDLEKCLPSIIKYLFKTWLRITEKNIVDSHSSRAKIWTVWEELGNAAIEWASWLSSSQNREVPKLLRDTKNLEELPDKECAVYKSAAGLGRFLVSVGYLDFNRDLTKGELFREFGQFGLTYAKEINRSWHKEGSLLFDRQTLFETFAESSGAPYTVDVGAIPDLIFDDESIGCNEGL